MDLYELIWRLALLGFVAFFAYGAWRWYMKLID